MPKVLTEEEAEAAWWRAAKGEPTASIAASLGFVMAREFADAMAAAGQHLSTARELARQQKTEKQVVVEKKPGRRQITDADLEWAIGEIAENERTIADIAAERGLKPVSLASRLRTKGIYVGAERSLTRTEQIAEIERLIRPVSEGGQGMKAAAACRLVGAEYRAVMQALSRKRRKAAAGDLGGTRT